MNWGSQEPCDGLGSNFGGPSNASLGEGIAKKKVATSKTAYSLVLCYIAMENGPLIVDLPIKNGDFP